MIVNGIDPTDLNNPFVKKISDLKFNTSTSVLLGKYRDAINAQRELADIAADHFELVTKVPSRVTGLVSPFSKMGMRTLLFKLINKFRIKTPNEKKFYELSKLVKKGHIKI